MKTVFISPKVERRIEELRNAGKAGRNVAHKAAGIIESLTSGELSSHWDAANSYTRKGEKRIRKSRKFALGFGYRLITLQRGAKFFVLLLGTHDESQRWLNNHRRIKEIHVGKGERYEMAVDSLSKEIAGLTDSAKWEVDDEEDIPANLTDQDLRRVFCGLVEGARKRVLKAQGF